VTEARLVRVSIALGIEEHIARCGEGRFLAVVQRDGFPRPSEVNQHEAAATQIAGTGQRDREGETDGNGSVNGIAPCFEQRAAEATGDRLLGRHHAPLGNDGMQAIVAAEDRLLSRGSRATAGKQRAAQSRCTQE